MRRIIPLLLLAVVAVACGDDAPTEPVGLTTGPSEFGTILVDGTGHTLYFLLTDRQSEPTCASECLSVWTPFLVEDRGSLGADINEEFVGSVTWEDGREQVTYNRWPLYLYRDDAPGDLNGHGALNAWFALAPNGGAVGVTE